MQNWNKLLIKENENFASRAQDLATDTDVLSKAAGLAKSGPVFQTIETMASGREVLRDLEEQYDVRVYALDEADIEQFFDELKDGEFSLDLQMWMISKVFDLSHGLSRNIAMVGASAKDAYYMYPRNKEDAFYKVLRLVNKDLFKKVANFMHADIFRDIEESAARNFIPAFVEDIGGPENLLANTLQMFIGEYNNVDIQHPELGLLNLTPDGAEDARENIRAALAIAVVDVLQKAIADFLGEKED